MALQTAANEFAQRYCDLVTALVKKGVPEVTAREEARYAATMVFLAPEHMELKPCSVCGHKEER